MGPFSSAAIALSLLGSPAQPPAPPPPQPAAPLVPDPAYLPSAAEIAARMQSELPQALPDGFTITAARAEGAMLILTMEIPPAVGAMAGSRFAFNIARGFCRGPRAQALFDSGLRLRIDTTHNNGPLVRGTVIETCPAS
jgi:hypothetical protein